MDRKIQLLRREKMCEGYCFEVVADQVIWPNGKKVKRSLIIHPGISVMVPVLDTDRLILIKQYRYGSKNLLWELPAGTINPGETPLQCAKREIEEEIGYKAKRLEKMISCYSSPHFSTEIVHCFVATDLIKTKINLDDDEIIEAKVFPVKKVKDMINGGKIQDAKTLVALFYYLYYKN
jgi:ADP-ribose pyrophosphatase|tara:strand:+ start:2645 stop:3178 length:534 start_codon:yes stop_codon:yes gene_type:complete